MSEGHVQWFGSEYNTFSIGKHKHICLNLTHGIKVNHPKLTDRYNNWPLSEKTCITTCYDIKFFPRLVCYLQHKSLLIYLPQTQSIVVMEIRAAILTKEIGPIPFGSSPQKESRADSSSVALNYHQASRMCVLQTVVWPWHDLGRLNVANIFAPWRQEASTSVCTAAKKCSVHCFCLYSSCSARLPTRTLQRRNLHVWTLKALIQKSRRTVTKDHGKWSLNLPQWFNGQ